MGALFEIFIVADSRFNSNELNWAIIEKFCYFQFYETSQNKKLGFETWPIVNN